MSKPASMIASVVSRAGWQPPAILGFGFSAQRFEPLIPHILGTARRT
jgi:hypothetical protein